MVSEFTEENLLKKEIEIIHAAYDNLENHSKRRKEEAKNLKNGLIGIENDREKTVFEFLSNLSKQLIDTAYMLETGIQDLVSKYKNSTIQLVTQNKQNALNINEENIKRIEEFDVTIKNQLIIKENL